MKPPTKKELAEALRRVILFAESCAAKNQDREKINWAYLEYGREILKRTKSN